MKVLFCIRSNYLRNIAGDTMQLQATVKYLCRMGMKVDINNGNIRDYTEYDIIHLFNLTRISETYNYFKTAKKFNKPIVITPIYWNIEKYYLYTGNESHVALWERNMHFRREIIKGSGMIYPSSKKEALLLKQEFGEDIPCTVVKNCIGYDLLKYMEPANSTEPDNKRDSFILCAARICPRKNQLVLADICKELGQKLVLAGEANNKEYLEKCVKLKNVRYMGHLRPKDLAELYRKAKLHVLCSFVETHLEAGAHGCNIVSTSEGCAEEYFGNMALYCNPYDAENIYKSVKNGLKINKQPMLKKHILLNYTPDICLEPLYDSYFKQGAN